jgi:hypothetical protein
MLRLALPFALLAALAPCQVEEVGGEPDVRAVEGEGRTKGARGQMGEKGEVAEENLTPEQRMARNITSGASAFCRFSASVSPAKLMPGQTGTLKVLAALQGNTVMPAPAPLELVAPAQQGALLLGRLAAQPASNGRLAAAYLGRPVYDNYAIFEVPVTVAGDAPMGSKHVASIDMKFDLYDGGSAQPIGRFLDRVGLEIEVGRVADPEVQGLARPAAEPAPAVAPPSAPTPAGDGAAPAASSPLQGNVVVPDAAPTTAPAEPAAGDGPAPVVAPEALPLPLLVGGGAVVLLVVAMLLRRK